MPTLNPEPRTPNPERTVLIVAGEASGDMHAADLMRAFRSEIEQAGLESPRFYGLGGQAMSAEAAAPLIPLERVSVIGLFEVLRHLPRIWLTMRDLVRSLDRERPALAVFVDFPDFNMRLAEQVKRRGIPVVWYISPQLWAWREHRVDAVKRLVDRMIVLFPFEVDFYRKHGMEVVFVGHPLIDRVVADRPPEDVRRDLGFSTEDQVVALLPGSRRSELKMYLEPMLRAAEEIHRNRPGVRFVLPLAGSLRPNLIEPALRTCAAPIAWRQGQTYELVKQADAAVVASGTATLETALLGTPMAILGRVSRLTELWLRRVANLPYYGLVNYVLGEKAVTELIQQDVTPGRIASEIERLLDDADERRRLAERYDEIRRRLGAGGAATRAGRALFEFYSSVIGP